ncbi:MAG: DegV family protein [Anaerolineae bacterium]|nr:DegV family protein [Anaerolineae bacterium]
MGEIRIVTDNSCDLPEEVAKQHGITVVPLIVRFGEETFLDVELPKPEFWRRAETAFPSTSGASLGYFMSAFQRLVSEGHHVLCLTLTSKHSSVYGSAWTAAREFPGQVTVCDSESISYGLAWQVLAAADAAAKGLPLEQILKIVADVRSRVKIALVLDTLSFVRRGGRADGFISLVDRAARALNIKPIITFTNGEMKLGALNRTWERGVKRILSDFAEKAPFEAFAVGHTFRLDRAHQFAQEIARETGLALDRIDIFETGAAIASHSGPGLLAGVGLMKAPESS